MSKIRIFELARNLNMTSKMLLDKMEEIGLSGRSHMSTLEDHEVKQLKEALMGGPSKDGIEETRIRPTVIRRRRKTPVSKKKTEEDAAGKMEQALTEESLEPADTKAMQSSAEEEAAAGEKEESRATLKQETVEKEEGVRAESEPVQSEEEKKKEPAKEIETATPKEVPAAKKVKKAKKKKTDTPAKIIKMPAPALPDKVDKEEKPQPASEPKKPEKEIPVGKRKKKVKKVEAGSEDTKFFKKRITFKKKAVIEGEDLYPTGYKRGKKQKKGGKGKTEKSQKPLITTPKASKRRIKIDETIILADLAKRMGIKASEMIKTLMGLGVMATVNQTIDYDTATLVAAEFGYEAEKAAFEEEVFIKQTADEPDTLMPRPPVVTIMGHVDHGKTSLLDVIRKTRVTAGEAGGITQHIGAYLVSTKKGRIVFLDTPGHEAFTAMRARGAKVTDIVVLVVAADDGVMPQTIEAINHSKAANVPIIVAINKMDKANANPDRVIRELADRGLTPEEWGGDTIFVKVSAKAKTGIDELLEMILLQAEILELKANPDKPAKGHVIEARLDIGRGPAATLLVQEGTLHLGDPVVCGVHYGKVRALLNDRGDHVESAGPATPVEIIGISGVPLAGDEFIVIADEKDARQISNFRIQKQRAKELARSSRLSLDKLYERIKEGEVKDLNLILKADVHGSIEALRESLVKLSNDEVKINIIHAATGTINESDINLAAVSDAIIIGFNVRPSSKFQALASEENVDMRFYNVIYDVIKDVKDAIVGMMKSVYEERILGKAEVRNTFHVPKIGTIAGCYVVEGKMERGRQVRVLRDGVVLYDSRISSLKRFKEDAKEVLAGYECGLGIENFNDIKVGDQLECYIMDEIRPEVS